VLIWVVREQATRETLAHAFRVSPATVHRVVARANRGATVADSGRRGGWTLRMAVLERRVTELFEKGLVPRAAQAAVAKHASYGMAQDMYREWMERRPAAAAAESAPPSPVQPMPALATSGAVDAAPVGEATAPEPVVERKPVEVRVGEPTLEAVAPPAGTVVQHVGSWPLLAGLGELGVYDLAARHRGDAVPMTSLRTATLLRHPGGISASWTRRVLHEFADAAASSSSEAMASRLLSPAGAARTGPSSTSTTCAGIRVTTSIARAGACRTSAPRRRRPVFDGGGAYPELAVSKLPAEALIPGRLARWGLQENQLKRVERWGINQLDSRRVQEYPPDALIPNPGRRRLERVLKLAHTAEGEAWRRWGRLEPDDPARDEARRDIDRAMERQRELMALRATVPAAAKVERALK